MRPLILAALTVLLTVPFNEARPLEDTASADLRYVWELADIYPSPEAWEAARQRVLDSLDEIEAR
ncbi:MAG: hypothetical protein ACREQZ_11755, partial [Woeseiaceae bacterium]